jgi:hypothetical protein
MYNAQNGDVAQCGGPAEEPPPTPEQELRFVNQLPRWDPKYSTQDDFYNACYYSFRCCTLTGANDGCYVSDNFGGACRSCLKNNAPAMVFGPCDEYLQLADAGMLTQNDNIQCVGDQCQVSPTPPVMTYVDMMASGSQLPPQLDANAGERGSYIEDDAAKESYCNEKFTSEGGTTPDMMFPIDCKGYAQMMEDGDGAWSAANLAEYAVPGAQITCAKVCADQAKNLPALGDFVLTLKPKTDGGTALNTCWVKPGMDDYRVGGEGMYADKCFEVISWCNLLCPRDTPQTVDHVMCKHCTLFGFKETSWDSVTFAEGLGALQGPDAREAQETEDAA